MHITMSVYGKSCCHLALVLPDLNKTQIKSLEILIFNFLWSNKPDKVSSFWKRRKPNVKPCFLGSKGSHKLKFSWFRRVTQTNAFWPEILVREIIKIVAHGVTISGKKMKNQFWKQILCSVSPFMQGAVYCYPENIATAPIWE